MNAQRQQGLAIITVLLIIALMVTLLGFLLEQQHLLMRRLANQNIAEQGYQYAVGVDEWAARVLYDDANRVIDYWDEDWAKFGDPPEAKQEERGSFSLSNSNTEEKEPLPTIDFGIDGLSYKIEDLQARYNLNNLANPDKRVVEQQKRIFINLLGLLEIAEFAQREELAAALIDWLDANEEGSLINAESPFYQSKKTPYFAADQKLTTLGELRYVEGFNESVINSLRPYVTVLPVENARINLNTTSAEVMTSLSGAGPELDTASSQTFLAQRQEEGFAGFQPSQIQAAQSAIIGAVPVGGSFINNMLQTNSQFYRVTTRVVLGDFRYCAYTTVFRQNPGADDQSTPKVSVLNRQYNTICDEIIR